MKTEHTPGPWWTYKKPGHTNSFVGSSTHDVAEVPHAGGEDTQASNARLIASAPELLDSLRECERVIRWAAQRSAGRVRADIVGGWLHQAEQARAAIARAEGQK
jgi:hypothetical protein